jgi:subfamily B ATP-binding cassette protein MsbA
MALRDLRALLQMTPMSYWATPTLIGLGLAASLAETLGISRVALFLFWPWDAPTKPARPEAWVGAFPEQIAARVGGGVPLACLIFQLIVLRGLLALAYISSAISGRISEAARNPPP